MTEISQHTSEENPVTVDESVVAQARHGLQEIADNKSHVGDFVAAYEIAENVLDFRFTSLIVGYEGWQWSITMYHDREADKWTINESSLIPTSQSLLAPEWIPWKDRLLPTDISPTDVLGTEADDERLEPGVRPEQAELTDTQSTVAEEKTPENTEQNDAPEFRKTQSSALESVKTQELNSAEQVEQSQEYREIVEEFELSRSRVLSPAGRAQTAQRWYGGPHGPKSLSTRVATGKTCQTCGFFVHIQGELGTMFGVCANKWSQDDGRVVSLDHGCGEHSDIDPPEPSQLWIQPEPTVDDGDEIIIVSRPRVVKPSAEERGIADILEDMDDPDNLVDNTDTDNTDTHDSSDLDDE